MIKNLGTEDIDSVIELLNQCRPFVIPHHKYQYWILSKYHSQTSFVFIESNKIVGFIGCLQSKECNSVFIWQICVHQNHKKKGIALKLLNELTLSMKKLDIDTIDLTITDGNEPSRGLFTNFAKSISSELVLKEKINIIESKENVYRIEI